MIALLTLLLACLAGTSVRGQELVPAFEYDCDPCIERSDRVIRMILHGSRDDPFWQLMEFPIRQIAESLRITLVFELYERVDFQLMASDIRAVAALEPRARPDVLVVTLPSEDVEEAVQEAVRAGIPVFGMNSGYNTASELGLLSFVGMDEYQAGVVAARKFQSITAQKGKELRRILFINNEKGNFALEQRRLGIEEGLFIPDDEASIDSLGSVLGAINATMQESLVVDELIVEGFSDPRAEELINDALRGCLYEGVIASAPGIEFVMDARENMCPEEDISLAVFDSNTRIYQVIAAGIVDFAISQQQWLQGAMATAMASLYASTGFRLQLSSETEFGTYLSGPHVITIDNVPADNLKNCETEGFPLCSAGSVLDTGRTERGCLCFEPSNIRLAAVTHGINTSPFWRRPRSAAIQAAMDMNVDIEFDLSPPEDDPDVLHTTMASKMVSFCQSGVDGLIVSIPSDLVVAAIEQCQRLNVPVISINAGGDVSERLGLLHHVAQDEYTAGLFAGRALVESGATRGICLNHLPELSFVVERCDGFRDALRESFGDDAYLGMVPVVEDNSAISVSRATQAVENAGGGWNDLGILVAGNALLPALLTLIDENPGAIGGTFDTGPMVKAALTEGKIVFGVDQQSYLQGYVPVLLLTMLAQTEQALVNRYISSGPSLVFSRPTVEQQKCEINDFAVCVPPIEVNKNQLGRNRLFGYLPGIVIMLTASLCALWVILKRHTRVMCQAQPIFLVMVSVGAALMGSTIFVLGVDDEIASISACDASCMAAPWLFAMGFTIVFAALYSKLVRLNKLIQNATHFRRITVTAFDVMVPFGILLTVNVALLTTWTWADPMFWQRSEVSETESYGLCRLGNTAVSIAMALGIFVVNMLALVLALIEAYKSRKVSYEFSDSGSIALVVVSILQVAIVGVPILPLVKEDPSASFLLKSGLVFVISMSTLLFIFVPKLRQQRGTKEGGGRSHHFAATSVLPTSNHFTRSIRSTHEHPPNSSASKQSEKGHVCLPNSTHSDSKSLRKYPSSVDDKNVPEHAMHEELHGFDDQCKSEELTFASDSADVQPSKQVHEYGEARASTLLQELGTLLDELNILRQKGCIDGHQVTDVVQRYVGHLEGDGQPLLAEDTLDEKFVADDEDPSDKKFVADDEDSSDEKFVADKE